MFFSSELESYITKAKLYKKSATFTETFSD